MKRTTFLIFFMYACYMPSAFAQTLYRTYYDYEKTHVHEEFYANSYGVKNGLYKEYSEYGGVLIEGTFKNDKREGKWREWNDNGKIILEQTYKNDTLNGLYTEYNDSGVKYQEGNYKDNSPVGNWYGYEAYQDNGASFLSQGPQHMDVPKSVMTGNEYVKFLIHFKHKEDYNSTSGLPMREQEFSDYGHIINIFYPSGKKYQEGHLKNGEWIGDFYQYFPNGRLEEFYVGDTIDGHKLFEKRWKYPGSTKDSVPYYKEQIKTSQEKAALEKQRQDSLNAISSKEAAIEVRRQDSINAISRKKAALEQQRQDSLIKIEWLRKQAKKDSITKMEEDLARKQNELSRQYWKIDSLYKVFTGIYSGSKKSVFLIDPRTHQPLITKTYPKGKHLYEKADTLFKSWNIEYKTMSDVDLKVAKGRNIIALLTKLDGMASADTDDLDKQMKKADTNEDIKKVLGL